MAAQPANTDISVFLRIRGQRQALRQESVAALIKRLRPLIAMIPGAEVLAGVLTRDTTTKDFSPYMGQASATAVRGFPIVYGLEPVMNFSTLIMTLPQADFPVQIGQDYFIQDTPATIASDDLFGDALALDSGFKAFN